MADFTAGEVLTAANLNNAINGPTINTQSGTVYTLVASDAGKLVTLSNANPITVTVPPESSVAFTAGAAIALAQTGAGQVTVAAGSGVTVNGAGSAITAQYSAAQLYYLSSDSWLLIGSIS